MATATQAGKENAVTALKARRIANEDRKRIDNSSLPAGSPMYYDCISCGAVITVPESWLSRPEVCEECMAMKRMGWPLD